MEQLVHLPYLLQLEPVQLVVGLLQTASQFLVVGVVVISLEVGEKTALIALIVAQDEQMVSLLRLELLAIFPYQLILPEECSRAAEGTRNLQTLQHGRVRNQVDDRCKHENRWIMGIELYDLNIDIKHHPLILAADHHRHQHFPHLPLQPNQLLATQH